MTKRELSKTTVMECRIDIRYLAALTKYLEENEILHKVTRGGIISASVTLLAETLEANGKANVPTSYTEAFEFLKRRGLAPVKRGGRNKLIQRLIEEDKLADMTISEHSNIPQADIDEAIKRTEEADFDKSIAKRIARISEERKD